MSKDKIVINIPKLPEFGDSVTAQTIKRILEERDADWFAALARAGLVVTDFKSKD